MYIPGPISAISDAAYLLSTLKLPDPAKQGNAAGHACDARAEAVAEQDTMVSKPALKTGYDSRTWPKVEHRQ